MPTTPTGIRSIHYHIDKVVLSLQCYPYVRQHLFAWLTQAGFKTTQDGEVRGNYRRIRSMKDAVGLGVKLTICYRPRAPYLPRMSLTIHDPTPDSLKFFKILFDELDITSFLSSVECAFDVTAADGQLLSLERRITSTLFLPYQRKSAGTYKSLTYYTTNIRTAAKGHRVYQKTINGHRVIRVELVLNRARLKAMAITLRNVLSIKPQALRKYVQFKTLNFDRLAAAIINKMLGTRTGKPINTGTARPHVTQLVRSAWRSALSVDMGDVVMPQYERLRAEATIDNYGRFLDRDTEFENEFWNAVVELSGRKKARSVNYDRCQNKE